MHRLYIISGCNGSGKTTASYSVLPELLGCRQFVNSDEFAKSLSPFKPEKAFVAASRFMLLKIRHLFQSKEDFCIETTLATRSLLKMIRKARREDYLVTIIYFWISSPELAISRVKARVEAGGHNIDEITVRRRYNVGLHYFLHDYSPECDRWILVDNSEIPFTVVAEGVKETVTLVRDEDKYSRILLQDRMFEEYMAQTGGYGLGR